MKACGCCGRKSPALKRALVFHPEQAPEIKLACRRCRLRALPAISPPPAQVPVLCAQCKREPGTVGASCYLALVQQVQELTRANLLLREELNRRIALGNLGLHVEVMP